MIERCLTKLKFQDNEALQEYARDLFEIILQQVQSGLPDTGSTPLQLSLDDPKNDFYDIASPISFWNEYCPDVWCRVCFLSYYFCVTIDICQYLSLHRLLWNQHIQTNILEEVVEKYDSNYHWKNVVDKTLTGNSFVVNFLKKIMGWLGKLKNFGVKLSSISRLQTNTTYDVDIFSKELIKV